MFVGPILNDSTLQLKIGDKLIITTDEKVIGQSGIISVKNCLEFQSTLQE